MKLKIRRIPKVRKNKKHKYKFYYNTKTRINSLTNKKNNLVYFTQNSAYYVKFTECCQIRFFNLKKLRNLLLPAVKRYKLKVWFFAHFYVPLTSKPLQRMGTGKGKRKCTVAKYRKGDIFMEFSDNFEHLHYKHRFMKLLRCVLPVHFKLMKNYV